MASSTSPPPVPAQGVRLGRKKIYILPTRHGLAFAALLMVMLAGAINYNNSLAYGLTFLLISMALISMFHTYRNLAGLYISGRPADDVFAGGPAYFQIRVDNLNGPARQGIVLRNPGQHSGPVLAMVIPAKRCENAAFPFTTQHRGWQHLNTITIASRAPFGIFRAWSPVQLGLPVLVYPTPAGTQALPSRVNQSSHERGSKGQGRDDFAGLREYQQGDSPKRIHWKLAARDDILSVKLFEGASTGELVLRADDVRTTANEARLSQLCTWILEAEKQRLHYGLDLNGRTIAPGSGSRHRRECLRQLALFGDDGSKP